MFDTVPLFYVVSIVVGFAALSVQCMICRKNFPVVHPAVKRKSTTVFLIFILMLNILDCMAPCLITSWSNPAGPVLWTILHIVNFRKIWMSCPQISDCQPGPVIAEVATAISIATDPQPASTIEDKIRLSACQFGLSSREVEIAALICKGKNTCEIAEELYLSPNTVKVHTSNLYRKIGVKNRVQALQVFQNCQ